MKLLKRGWLLCAILVLLGSTALAENNTVKVGVFRDGMIGTWETYGYKLAFSKLNQTGVNIKPIYLRCPTAMNRVMDMVEQLDNDGVVAFLGGSNSRCTSYLAGLSQRHKIPLISPYSSMELLSRFGFEYVFRLNAPVRWYLNTLMDYAAHTSPKPKTVAFVWEDTPFGRRFTVFAADKAKSLHLNVVVNEKVDFADKGRHATDLVIKKKPDVLVLVGNQEDGLRILRWLKEANYKPKVLIGAGAGYSMDSFLKAQKGAAEGLVTATQWYPDADWSGTSQFVKAFKEKYHKTPNYLSAESYAAVQVLSDALQRAQCSGVKQCRESLKKALISTQFNTVFGPVKFESFSGYTNQNRHPVLLLKIQNGKLTPVPRSTASN